VQEQVTEERRDEAISDRLIPSQEIASLAASDILSSRGTRTSLCIALAMTGNMN